MEIIQVTSLVALIHLHYSEVQIIMFQTPSNKNDVMNKCHQYETYYKVQCDVIQVWNRSN